MTFSKKMTLRSTLGEFAGRFVITTFRERFVHEAIKKPAKLHERICHQIVDVFPTRYCLGRVPFDASDRVIPLVGTEQDLKECYWKDIENYVGTGFGLLVISADMMHFYAETEAEAGFPSASYSSQTQKK